MILTYEMYHSMDNELYHHGVKGQKWGVRNYEKHQSKVGTARTNTGMNYRMDKAAYRNQRNVRKESIKEAKGLRSKIHNAYGYTGISKQYDARAKSYSESANTLKEAGKMKQAIRAQAVSKNNSEASSRANTIANAKGYIDRSITKLEVGYGKHTAYSKAGREYSVRSEIMKNSLTLGLHGVHADRKYKKQYTEQERYDRIQ